MESAKKCKDLSNKLRLCQSEVEKQFLIAADKLGHLKELEPQYPALSYYIDFAIVDRKIAIEIDGHEYHKTQEQRTRDYQRERELGLDGWRFIRFTGSEVRKDAIGCAKRATIEEASDKVLTKKSRHARFCELYQIAKMIDTINSSDGSVDDKSLQINSQETQNMHDRGIILLNEGKYEESIKIFDELIEKNPSFICTYNNLGCALIGLGRYEEAIGYFEIILKRNHLDAVAWANKGNALSELSRYDEAIRCCDEALRIRNRYTLALNLKGIALAKQGHIEESFACLDAIFKKNPKLPSNAPVWNDKGEICFEFKKYKNAVDCYERSIELDPSNPIVWNNKGKTHYIMNQFREANECYNNAIQLDPLYEDAWFNKGKALEKLKIKDEAESAFMKARDIKLGKQQKIK